MSLFVLFLLAAFITAVHRRARQSIVIVYCIACYYLFFSMLSGCASTPPAPAQTVTQHPLACDDLPHDGSYLLLRCSR